DVRGRSVHSFKDGALVTQVRAGHKSQPAHKGRAQVRNNIAVKVLHHQHVVLIRIHDQLHAGVIHDVLAVGDLGKVLGHAPAAPQEQSVGQLHDVGFVDSMNLLPLIL